MSNGLWPNTKTFAKNVWLRVHGVLTHRFSVRDALNGMRRDGKKLRRTLAPSDSKRREATHVAEKARRAYNKKDYVRAEKGFRKAIAADPGYALAHTYLGHCLYQLGRLDDAVGSWRRAIEAEPNSDAAQSARKKIGHVQKNKAQEGVWGAGGRRMH